jgi:tetratricopeptide (TPR) repeat protein
MFLLLLVPVLCMAQYEDGRLYEAYLAQDLTLWREYITTADWTAMTAEERTRLINYEYGFIPAEADRGSDDCRRLLDVYTAHVEEHRPYLSPSQYAAYRSAAHAYEYLLDKHRLLSDGWTAFRMAGQALEADSLEPLALSLKGNMDFYAPVLLGGCKKRALELFLEAERQMRKDEHYRLLWNYPALQLCIAQCYEKTGRLQDAIDKCEEILREHPAFLYVSRDYLPSLRRRQRS